MRTKIEPHKEVVRAWKTSRAMMDETGANFFINGARVMDIAERKLRSARWRQGELAAEVLFLKAVIRCHGPETIVEIVAGEFTLYSNTHDTPSPTLRRIKVIQVSDTNAQQLLMKFGYNDPALPNKQDVEALLANNTIPEELRVYDLLFPRVVSRGLSEGQGDRVTDDSILMLVWDGNTWWQKHLLAGPRGWGRSGPDVLNLRARLAVFA